MSAATYAVPQMADLNVGGSGTLLEVGGQSQAGFVTDTEIDWGHDYVFTVVFAGWSSPDSTVDPWVRVGWGDYGMSRPSQYTQYAYVDVAPGQYGCQLNIFPDEQPRYQLVQPWALPAGNYDTHYIRSENSYWGNGGQPGPTTPCRFATVISLLDHDGVGGGSGTHVGAAAGTQVQLGNPSLNDPSGHPYKPVQALMVDSFVNYSWDFGDGKGASTPGPSTDHAYEAGGSYAPSCQLSAYQNQTPGASPGWQLRNGYVAGGIVVTQAVPATVLDLRVDRMGTHFYR